MNMLAGVLVLVLLVTADEGIRPDSTAEALARLRPAGDAVTRLRPAPGVRPRRGPFADTKKDGGPRPAVQYHVAVESAVDQNFAWRPTNT